MNAKTEYAQDSTLLKPARILVPVDFTLSSAQALRAAGTLAHRFRASLSVIHVTAEAGQSSSPEATGKLREFITACLPAEITATGHLAAGVPHFEITRAAATSGADLIVIATHGHTWLARAILGSTAERVMQHAPCPVLIVGGGKEENAATAPLHSIRKIVVPTDFSPSSAAAFPTAATWAREFRAELKLIYVVPESLPNDLSHLGLSIGLDQQLRKTAENALARLREMHFPSDLTVETSVVVGVPVHEICSSVAEPDNGLIIMASHGRTGFEHFCIGSVAERVVQHAACPVLVVRRRKPATSPDSSS